MTYQQLVRTPLWPHQIEDLQHLTDEACILQGSDMGYGKTLFAMERDLQLRAQDLNHKKTLIIAPLNTHGDAERGWIGTITNNTTLRLSVIDPKNRSAFLKGNADIYLMHPHALQLMPELRDVGFTHVIADECQYFKNRKAKMTQALKKIRTTYKLGMSGSPADDKPHDLWSILNWLYPHVYTSFWKFYKQAVEYEIVYPGGFHKVKGPSEWWTMEGGGLDRIRPFFVRRLLEEVMPHLTQPVYTEVAVDLGADQRRAYNEMRDEMIAWLGEHKDQPLVAPVVISRLQRLQMLALTHMDYNEETDRFVMSEPSAKLDAVMELIESSEIPFVVFSQFKAPLQLLGRRLDAAGIKWGRFTGDDTQLERGTAKEDFISGTSRVFLSTIKAGGVGVDGLQHRCSTVVFLDRDWSPMANKQAEGRLHRGGQTGGVHVIDIVARNTVDRGRLQKIEQKWEYIRKMLGDI